MQYVMRLFLADTPHKADMAFTANEGIQMFQKNSYDVVLLDQVLSDLSPQGGLWLTRCSHLPVRACVCVV